MMRFAYIVIFVGTPLMALMGFTMFRFTETWARLNEHFSNKKFDSPEQLARTKKLGVILMMVAALSLASVLATDAINKAYGL